MAISPMISQGFELRLLATIDTSCCDIHVSFETSQGQDNTSVPQHHVATTNMLCCLWLGKSAENNVGLTIELHNRWQNIHC